MSELKEEDFFKENVNLIIQDLNDYESTLDSYIKITENQIKTMVPDGKVIESKFHKEKNYHEIVWSGYISERNLKFKQYVFTKNKNVYLLTLTTLPETFEEYTSIGNKILNSFKLN